MKKQFRFISMFLILVLCVFMFASCDSGTINDKAENMSPDSTFENGLVIDGIDGSGINSNINSGTSKPSVDNTNDNETSEDQESEFDTKIIKKYNLDTETKTFNVSIDAVENLIETMNGYIESSSVTGRSYNNGQTQRIAKYVIRVPAVDVENFVKNTSSMLNVISSNSTAQNVTAAYYDLQSRYNVLEAEKTALNNMLAQASTVDTMLKIRNQLNDVISEMESIKTQLKVYDSLVSYSTVTLKITEVVEYTPIDVEKPSWGSRFVDAFKESWANFAENFQDFTIWLTYAFPTLLVLGILAALVGYIFYVSNKHSQKSWEEKRKKKMMETVVENKPDYDPNQISIFDQEDKQEK